MLSRDEFIRMQGSVPIGRIVYTRQALPAVELVTFTLDDGDITRTDASGKLATTAPRVAAPWWCTRPPAWPASFRRAGR